MALRRRGGVVRIAGYAELVGGSVRRSGCERQRLQVEIERIALGDHAIGVFDDRDVADVLSGESLRAAQAQSHGATGQHRLAMQVQFFVPPLAVGAADDFDLPGDAGLNQQQSAEEDR